MGKISTGTMGVGVLAILFGLVAAYGLRAVLLREPPPEPPRETETFSVPLASTDLPAGRVLVLGDISLHSMTRQEMADYPMDKLMMNTEQIIGRQLREPLKQGEPFLTSGMYLQGSGPPLSEMLKPGMRAVTVTVPDERGGTVTVGSFVDVVFRHTPARGGDTEIPEMTVTLIEGVEVLHVDRAQLTDLQANVGYTPRDPHITLAVTLGQANALQAVAGRGELSLVVRPEGEAAGIGAAGTKQLTLEDLLGYKPPEPPEPPPPPFPTEIYRRTSRSINLFQGNMLVQASGRGAGGGGAARSGARSAARGRVASDRSGSYGTVGRRSSSGSRSTRRGR